jgi:hypothetical protein
MNGVQNPVNTVENVLALVTLGVMRAPQRPIVCPDCGNFVTSHVTKNGKQLLLEFGAWEDGNVIIEGGVAHVLGRNDPRRFDGRLLLMPHKAQCRAARVKQSA